LGNLRKAGIAPKGYKANALTKNQKDYIRKLERKYAGPAHRPQEFVHKVLSRSTIKKLKEAGYRTKGKTALFEKFGAERVYLSPEGVVRESGNVTRTSPIYSRVDIFKQAEKFFKHKKPGEYLTLRVGDKRHFARSIRSMKDFMGYMNWIKQTRPKLWEEVVEQNHLTIVKVKNVAKP